MKGEEYMKIREEYISAEIEIVKFESEDVITTSTVEVEGY